MSCLLPAVSPSARPAWPGMPGRCCLPLPLPLSRRVHPAPLGRRGSCRNRPAQGWAAGCPPLRFRGPPVQGQVPAWRVPPPCLLSLRCCRRCRRWPHQQLSTHSLPRAAPRGTAAARPLAALRAAHVPFPNHFCYTPCPPCHKDHVSARLSDLNVWLCQVEVNGSLRMRKCFFILT